MHDHPPSHPFNFSSHCYLQPEPESLMASSRPPLILIYKLPLSLQASLELILTINLTMNVKDSKHLIHHSNQTTHISTSHKRWPNFGWKPEIQNFGWKCGIYNPVTPHLPNTNKAAPDPSQTLMMSVTHPCSIFCMPWIVLMRLSKDVS